MEKLSSIFMDIGRSAPRHQAIAMLYPRSTKLQSYLSEYFVVVVRLCHYLYKFGQKTTFQQYTSSLNDGNLVAFQAGLGKWASSIEQEMQVSEAIENSEVRALSRSMFDSTSYQHKLAAKNRMLDLCSTYDHETIWKQTRKSGNTFLHSTFTQYKSWKTSPHSCTLIITGQLGSGKSVLLANIVDDLSFTTEKERPLVTYFFCRHDVPESLQARTILGSLARQLFRTLDSLDLLSASCGDTYSISDIDKITDMMLCGYPASRKTYFLLDGLDECSDRERETLVQAVRKLQEKLNVLICASFRVEPNKGLQSITKRFLSTQVISLPKDNPDIEAFIEADLERCLSEGLLTLGEATLIFEIQDALLAGSQGMFLWTTLQIQSLCNMNTDHAIREALADLPKDLSETFARVLLKSGSSNKSLQAKTLQLVLAAYRPFTTEELREALSVTPGDATWEPSRMLNEVQSALACCGCLLTLDEEESTVRVIHHSVRRYILHDFDGVNPMGFPIEAAQRTLADVVVTYLGYPVFDKELSRTNARRIAIESAPSKILESAMGTSSTTRQLAVRLLRSRKQPTFRLKQTVTEMGASSTSKPDAGFKFYAYARVHWQNHVMYVTGQDDIIRKLSAKLIRSRTLDIALDATFEGQCRWAVEHGNMKILDQLFQNNNTHYEIPTPLAWAVRLRNVYLVGSMLDAGVDVRPHARWSSTLLIEAACNGDQGVVGLLLKSGKFDVNAASDAGTTALMGAVSHGHRDVVQLLLETRDIIINAPDKQGSTAMKIASSKGRKSILTLLLEATLRAAQARIPATQQEQYENQPCELVSSDLDTKRGASSTSGA